MLESLSSCGSSFQFKGYKFKWNHTFISAVTWHSSCNFLPMLFISCSIRVLVTLFVVVVTSGTIVVVVASVFAVVANLLDVSIDDDGAAIVTEVNWLFWDTSGRSFVVIGILVAWDKDRNIFFKRFTRFWKSNRLVESFYLFCDVISCWGLFLQKHYFENICERLLLLHQSLMDLTLKPWREKCWCYDIQHKSSVFTVNSVINFRATFKDINDLASSFAVFQNVAEIS